MKHTLPIHPHAAKTEVFKLHTGKLVPLVTVELAAPSRIAAMLPERWGFHTIQSAGIGEARHIAPRARSWTRAQTTRKAGNIPPLTAYLQAAIEEGCDTAIRIHATPEEWHLIGTLCGKLGITPGQWYLACAAYNAEIEERRIDSMIAAIPKTADAAP